MDPSLISPWSGLSQGGMQSPQSNVTQPGFNGYPMFSSQSSGSPSGFAGTAPVSDPTSATGVQGRMPGQGEQAPQGNAPQPAQSNPWAISSSSGFGDPYGYPMGNNSKPPSIATL